MEPDEILAPAPAVVPSRGLQMTAADMEAVRDQIALYHKRNVVPLFMLAFTGAFVGGRLGRHGRIGGLEVLLSLAAGGWAYRSLTKGAGGAETR
jgi:hypothetical protein